MAQMSSSCFVRVDEAHIDHWHAMITGPEDTPYEGGCFIFDIQCTGNYPQSPPSVLLLTTGGIFFLPVDIWTKGYLGMGLYFTVSSAFTLAKTVRDAHENGRLINRIAEARTEQMLREYSDAA